ncbi:tyramine beta-hydroxylase isoform X1 [Diorhabda carinulata]|uniref:tyramine beta-hydroxylase isoform X1 n=1 Tax=Diorhabda carinulata TaxID=1163345 RepID=UPI0025A298E7|nr:tyramine beta-hydroxylase isoform X1 [Diorhabda carinulata]
MWKNCGKTFIICVVFVSYIKNGNGNGIYHVSLRGDNSIKLYWSLDYNSETVIFEIHIPSDYGWFAIGFSDRGNLFPSDICLLWRDLKGISHLKDVYVDKNGVTHNDKQEDCNNFKIKRNSNITKFAFERRFDTCDQQDYIIEEGTTHIVWSRGNHNLYKPEGINISSTPDNHGMVRVNLLKNTKVNYYLPSHVKIFDFLNDKVEVPAEETTYWCRIIKLPEEFKKKHHIYQYAANIQEASEGLVHHMEVFHCQTGADEEIPLYNGDCFGKNRPPKTQVCKRVLAAWAMGAPPFKYPKEASLPIGGENFNPYIMLEVHYNNPDLRAGIIDSSGIRFHISSKLKEMDAGVIELGLEYTDKMAIPPGQDSFSLTGYCISSCTAMSLPVSGITVFGSQLHTHLTGIRVVTRHFDAYGRELPELNRDNHFSTHFQEIRILKSPVQILPGHTLITKCDYNTEDRENITLGGFSISDEMCVNYIHYFPASELEVCKSSISDQALHTFFRYMNEWENQYTLPENGISDNYKAIKWNRMRIQLLDEVYNGSPISMQCNMSSGDRFPGYWENAPLPYLSTTLGPPPRFCDNKFK